MPKVQTIDLTESMNYCVLRELEVKEVLSGEAVATPDKHILPFFDLQRPYLHKAAVMLRHLHRLGFKNLQPQTLGLWALQNRA